MIVTDLWLHSFQSIDFTHTSDYVFLFLCLGHFTMFAFQIFKCALRDGTFRPRRTAQYVLIISIFGIIVTSLEILQVIIFNPATTFVLQIADVFLSAATFLGNTKLLKKFCIGNKIITPERVSKFQVVLVAFVIIMALPMIIYGFYVNDFSSAPGIIFTMAWLFDYVYLAIIFIYQWLQAAYIFGKLYGLSQQMMHDQSTKRRKIMNSLYLFLLVLGVIWDSVCIVLIYILNVSGNPASLTLIPWDLASYHCNFLVLQFYLIQIIYTVPASSKTKPKFVPKQPMVLSKEVKKNTSQSIDR